MPFGVTIVGVKEANGNSAGTASGHVGGKVTNERIGQGRDF
jgi:hypothetical protein